MAKLKHIILTVSNDLVYDRRMQRIAGALQSGGYQVTLLGRYYEDSPALMPQDFKQVRLPLFFRKGKMFYLELQIRLFFKLLVSRVDILCAIDLDTIIPTVLVGWLRGKKRVFDAHEYFTEVPELLDRPGSRKVWDAIGKWAVPKMDLCYTVGPALADIFEKYYGKPFGVIRNLPLKTGVLDALPNLDNKVIWYQGALNRGRGLEEAIDGMFVFPGWSLWIAGEGDLSVSLREQVRKSGLEERVRFLGWVNPEDLPGYAASGSIGLNLLDGRSKSYYYSLANKTLDYIQGGMPAIYMDFPEYQALASDGQIGVGVPNLELQSLANALRKLMDPGMYQQCQDDLLRLREVLTWEKESEILIDLYKQLS